MLPPGARRGRATIIVDDWGPYDYSSPKIWPSGKPTDRPLNLRVLRPGREVDGASRFAARIASRRSPARCPARSRVTPPGPGSISRSISSTSAPRVVTPRGQIDRGRAAVPFSYTLFDPASTGP